MSKNITWGISFSSFDSEESLPRELPECFSLLELPGFLLSPLSRKKLKLSYLADYGIVFPGYDRSCRIARNYQSVRPYPE